MPLCNSFRILVGILLVPSSFARLKQEIILETFILLVETVKNDSIFKD